MTKGAQNEKPIDSDFSFEQSFLHFLKSILSRYEKQSFQCTSSVSHIKPRFLYRPAKEEPKRPNIIFMMTDDHTTKPCPAMAAISLKLPTWIV